MGVFLFRKLSAGESTEDGVAIVLQVIKINADHLKSTGNPSTSVDFGEEQRANDQKCRCFQKIP
jgi:hypothetical protein